MVDILASNPNNQLALAKARAGIYGLLSSLFTQELSASICTTLVQTQVRLALEELFDQSEEVSALVKEAERALADATYLDELRLEFHRLFLVPGPTYLTPFESCYREKKVDGSAGGTWGKSTREVKAIYARFGIQDLEKIKLLPDQIGAELGFMQFLTDKEISAHELENNKQIKDLKLWQKHFVQEHIICWVPELTRKLNEFADSRFYMSLARLTELFLYQERDLLTEES